MSDVQLNTPPAEPVEVDALIATYDTQAEWIRFADAKAAAVLTANGALVGLLVPSLHDAPTLLEQSSGWVVALPLVCFVVWLAAAAVSAVEAFRCIMPYRQRGRHPADETCPHFHSVGIAKKYGIGEVAKFITDAQAEGETGYRRQIFAAMLADAHISTNKYTHVTKSIRYLGYSAVFAVLYLLTPQVLNLYFRLSL